MGKILILESRQYEVIADKSLSIVHGILGNNKFIIDTISVDKPLSLLCAASISLELYDYEGMIILGVIFKNDNIANKMIYKQILRCFSDLSVHYALPIGFGVIFAQNEAKAELILDKEVRSAVEACLDLIKLKNQLSLIENEPLARYSN